MLVNGTEPHVGVMIMSAKNHLASLLVPRENHRFLTGTVRPNRQTRNGMTTYRYCPFSTEYLVVPGSFGCVYLLPSTRHGLLFLYLP
jgi:hypothetical protein